MDSEFLALALFFIIAGAAGVILFNGPLTSTKDSCVCLIPSPEPGAAQGTSSILLVFGILFLPIGLLKGGPPSFGRRPAPGPQPRQSAPQSIEASGAMVAAPTGIPMRSGRLYALGILLILVGVDAITIPGFLLFHNFLISGAGVALVVLGLFTFISGVRSS